MEIKGNLNVLRQIQASWFKFRSGNQAEFLNIQVNPTQVAIDAPKGSLAIREFDVAEVYVKLDNGETVNWRKLSDLTVYNTVNNAEAASGSQNLLSFVVENDTFYRYEENGDSYTPNGEQALSTGDGGNSRWLAVAGYKSVPERFQKYAQTIKACGFTLSGSDNESSISFDGSSRVFTLTPNTEEVIWRQDELFKINNPINVTLDDVSGRHFVYFGKDASNSGEVELRVTTNFSDDQRKREALVSTIYFDSASNQYLLKDERHSASIPVDSRFLEHSSHGSFVKPSGGVISATVGDGSDVAHAQIGISDAILVDEDIRHSISDNNVLAEMPVVYKDGTSIKWDASSNLLFREAAGQAQINSGNNQVAVSNGEFFCSHIFAIGDDLVAVQGRVAYSDVNDAFASAYDEIQTIFTDMEEFLYDASALGTIVFEANTAFAANARLVQNWLNYTSLSWVENRLNNTNRGKVVSLLGPTGASEQSGTIVKSLRKASSNTTLSLNTDEVIWCNSSTSNITVTLPVTDSGDVGKVFVIKKTSTSNKVILSSSQNIEGSSDDYELLEGNRSAVTIQTDGSEWYAI